MNESYISRKLTALFHLTWLATTCVVCVPILDAQDAQVIATNSDGFHIASPGYDFSFPRDHGSHPLYRIEWWYLTGHFKSEEDQALRFGFQATFFRFAQKRPAGGTEAPLEVDDLDQLFLAHMALVDKTSGKFIHEERFQRGNWDAWAKAGDLDVRNGNWSLERDDMLGHDEAMRLTGSVLAGARWTFDLVPAKPRVIFGEDGVSRKGDAESAASLYITFPRLDLRGTIDWEGETHNVTGQAWMDHEISSSQLDEEQAGWDWASIQLDDGREIMMYLMRTTSGEYDSWSKLYWIDRESRLTPLKLDEFQWRAKTSWTSAKSGATYPQDFELSVMDPLTRHTATLRLKPVTADQEIFGRLGGINYWEGACDVLDGNGNKIGQAYVELAGYDGRLSERVR